MDSEPANQNKFNVEINSEWKVSPEMLVMGLFGVSLDQLINNIRVNKDGEYDSIYKT